MFIQLSFPDFIFYLMFDTLLIKGGVKHVPKITSGKLDGQRI